MRRFEVCSHTIKSDQGKFFILKKVIYLDSLTVVNNLQIRLREIQCVGVGTTVAQKSIFQGRGPIQIQKAFD